MVLGDVVPRGLQVGRLRRRGVRVKKIGGFWRFAECCIWL